MMIKSVVFSLQFGILVSSDVMVQSGRRTSSALLSVSFTTFYSSTSAAYSSSPLALSRITLGFLEFVSFLLSAIARRRVRLPLRTVWPFPRRPVSTRLNNAPRICTRSRSRLGTCSQSASTLSSCDRTNNCRCHDTPGTPTLDFR